QVRQFLSERLPDYMQPGAVRLLTALPRLPSGKIDYRSLPVDEVRPRDATALFAGPHSGIEQSIAQLWCEMLGVESVGRHDSFFELGGDSINAALIIARLNDLGETSFGLRLLFDNPTVAELAEAMTRSSQAVPRPAEQKVERDGIIPLASGQKRLWFLQYLVPESCAYHFSVALRIAGPLDIDAMAQSLSAIVRRHEIWRTTFPMADGQPVQKIHPAAPVTLRVADLSHFTDDERLDVLEERAQDEIRRRFDLTRLPLVRWTLYRLAADRHVLLHCEHHLVHDGWSFNVFLNELVEHYRHFTARSKLGLGAVEMQFADYAIWEHQWMAGDQAKRSLVYWRQRLGGAPELPTLPTDFPRPDAQRFAGTLSRAVVDHSLALALRRVAQQHETSLFMVMFSAFAMLLHRYSRATDICIGSGFANRQTSKTAGMLGMLVNDVVLRVDFDDDPTARDVLNQVRRHVLDGQAHQAVPFDKVVEALRPTPSLAYNPVFQTVFSFHDAPMPRRVIPDLTVDIELLLDDGSAKFDINVIVLPQRVQRLGDNGEDESLTMVWEYNTDLYRSPTIAGMQDDYRCVLDTLAADLDCRVSAIALPRLAVRSAHSPDFKAAMPRARTAVSRSSAHESQAENSVQATLIDIWKEVLGEEQLGVHDNFFDLGGHSLSLVQIASRIHDAFGVKLDYQTLFAAASVAAQAEAVAAARAGSRPLKPLRRRS
ncbi:MAG: condensation domain-containing protein, partial [Gammaproteobacteria bacterium]|nr:condensation domain-containing protein [Gammaproteobacteria bacterium]